VLSIVKKFRKFTSSINALKERSITLRELTETEKKKQL